ncbi:MAG TPA: hypothetical protein DDX51_01665 [Clostridiales bacterium]|nr:hypothetical protein [Clostridiales bacterium]
MLSQVKQLLGITGDELDAQLGVILSGAEQRLRLLLGGVDQVPDALRYILPEVTVVRFNRIGSEGMAAHSVEGESITFSDDDFAGYLRDIEAYLDEQTGARRGRVRLL